jgi:hypothetical protein
MAKEYSMRVQDNGIVVFNIPDMTRNTIDKWMEDLARLGQAWIADELVLLLIDLRGLNIATPYIRDKLVEVSTMAPATPHIRTAFWVDSGPAKLVWERFADDLGPLLGDKRTFTNRDTAEDWLCEVL